MKIGTFLIDIADQIMVSGLKLYDISRFLFLRSHFIR